jgi:hypothetical protein
MMMSLPVQLVKFANNAAERNVNMSKHVAAGDAEQA